MVLPECSYCIVPVEEVFSLKSPSQPSRLRLACFLALLEVLCTAEVRPSCITPSMFRWLHIQNAAGAFVCNACVLMYTLYPTDCSDFALAQQYLYNTRVPPPQQYTLMTSPMQDDIPALVER